MTRPFFIALQFLTRIPVSFQRCPEARETAQSLLFYPLVGLLIGLLLTATGWLLAGLPPMLGAALLLSTWVVLTGGLHLDGLADSADAWAGGRGDRERMLAIMKDPCLGPIGMTAVALVLILKFAALASLLQEEIFLPLIAAALLARTALPLLFLTTSYRRSSGLGSALVEDQPRGATLLSVILGYAALPLLFGLEALWAVAVGLLGFVALRYLMQRHIGGTTGDTAGALVELSETLILVCSFLLLTGATY